MSTKQILFTTILSLTLGGLAAAGSGPARVHAMMSMQCNDFTGCLGEATCNNGVESRKGCHLYCIGGGDIYCISPDEETEGE